MRDVPTFLSNNKSKFVVRVCVCVLMHFNQFVRHLASPQMQMILAYCKHTHARASLGSHSLALLSRNCTALLYTNTHTYRHE